MLLWPWVFLAGMWASHGIAMDYHLEFAIQNHPQRTNFVITLFANIVSIIVSILFSTAVVHFSQKWAMSNDQVMVTVFDVSLISAFRNQNWPWGINDHRYLLIRKRWFPAVLAGVCIAAFALVPSGTTSLITPVSFKTTSPVQGTELDFSSIDTHCDIWQVEIDNTNCDWKVSRLKQNT
jgi:hypothetical protein